MADGFGDFIQFFLDEAQDALNVWEKACLDLERDDSQEAREELYRAAHNLKSGSGAVGLTRLNEFIHHVEDLIAKLLNGQIPSQPEVIRIFLKSHSVLNAWIESLRVGQDGGAEPEIQAIYESIDQMSGQKAAVIESPAAETREVATAPSLLPAELLLQSLNPGTAPAPAPPPVEAPTPQPEAKNPAATSSKGQESIRVAALKLDQLIQLVGELSTQQAIVWHARQNGALLQKSSDHAIQLIQKIAKDLQSLALSLRLQPLQGLFQRLERTGRDLARDQGKKIAVVLHGEHVEVDRTVIERIADALNHVIRNAVDHGIEPPDERVQRGKTETATLRIEAVQETSGVLITVREDGRGLATEKILKKAVERGLVSPEAKLQVGEIHRLIFHAGLSTAEKISDISGRGVGMDVVKNSVETIGGSIHVASQDNQGTSFAIALPATLSIIDALIVAVDGGRYAIPVQDVAEIIDGQQSRIEPISGFGRLLTLREQLIPVETLSSLLPQRRSAGEEAARSFDFMAAGGPSLTMRPALIVKNSGESLAFEVDRILGQQPVTVRRLPHLIAHIPGYTGGTILGDGDPCVILNLPSLVSRYFEAQKRTGSAAHDDDQMAYGDRNDDASPIENRYLMFESHERRFCSPLLSIQEILSCSHFEPMVGQAPHVLGSINLRGHVVPVYDLGLILGLGASSALDARDIVLTQGTSILAMRVDRICSVTQLAVMKDSIQKKHEDIVPGFYGYSGTGSLNGSSIPILDLTQTVEQYEAHHQFKSHSPQNTPLIAEAYTK